MDLNKLLRPKSVAVVGAGEKSGFAKSSCVNLMNSAGLKSLYFVNPGKTTVFGRPCYRSLEELPEPPDLCVVIVNRRLVLSVLEDAVAVGCRAAVVYASGYSETGRAEDRDAEDRLSAWAKENDMAVMGVNCAGFVNNTDGIFPFGMLFDGKARPGGIGIISQSGKICLNMMQVSYTKYSHLISSGNNTVLTMEDYLEFLVEDAATKVVGLYLEAVEDAGRLAKVLSKALARRKPVVVMKVGRSEKGGRLAASHTGSLSGSDESFDAFAKKFGLIRVDDIEELIETCHMFSVLQKMPEKGTFAAMSLSGGETGVCADVGERYGIEFPGFSLETETALKDLLPGFATIHNPLDMTATLAHDGKKYGAAVRAVADDPSVGMVLCGFSILPVHNETDVIFPMSEGMVMAAEGDTPIGVMSFIGGSRDDRLRTKLERAGVPILPPTRYGFKILSYLRDYVDFDPALHSLSVVRPVNSGESRPRALSESASKKELAAFGAPVATERLITDINILDEKDLPPFPLVLKIESDEILHKSDVDGVRLGISNRKQLEAAYFAILEAVRQKAPAARINGVLAAPMLPEGVEMIIGVHDDPQFGLMLLCGLGGVFVEIFKDVSLYPVPVNRIEAKSMLRSLKGYSLLEGTRGRPACDVESLVALMVTVSDYAVARKEELLEMDLNPVFVHQEGEGVSIADALIVKRDR